MFWDASSHELGNCCAFIGGLLERSLGSKDLVLVRPLHEMPKQARPRVAWPRPGGTCQECPLTVASDGATLGSPSRKRILIAFAITFGTVDRRMTRSSPID